MRIEVAKKNSTPSFSPVRNYKKLFAYSYHKHVSTATAFIKFRLLLDEEFPL